MVRQLMQLKPLHYLNSKVGLNFNAIYYFNK